ncbi:hypothetical protein [Massilia sp. BJB1822]|uniref:hypothetical protein n=1 Tax=Massilia sp. BJB1822 TaxID=2744470 RepID=UPI0015935CD9|nr:hypothetical protein [Massilia sp. BJB1822]NVE00402.1 hypothetical protein [Massilia sp. BJB1822]
MINFYILKSGRPAVRRLCSSLQGTLVIFVALQILYFCLAWGGSHAYDLVFVRMSFYPDGMSFDQLLRLSFTHRLMGVVLGLPVLGTLFYAVLQLNSILAAIKDGMIFSLRTIAAMQAFTGALLLYVVLSNLEKPLRALIINAMGQTGLLRVLYSLSSHEMLLVLVCALFYILTAIMHEGRRLEEENKGFV